jgi:hypothetical protein
LLWIRQYIIAGGAYDAHLMVRKLKKKNKTEETRIQQFLSKISPQSLEDLPVCLTF